MLTSNDQINLDRHLKQASQLLKQRSNGWCHGMNSKQAYGLEKRLLPSIRLLSLFAEEFFSGNWPKQPWPLKVSLIASLFSDNEKVFSLALDQLAELLKTEEADSYAQLLWLALSDSVTKAKLDQLIEHSLLSHFTEQQFHQLVFQEEAIRKLAVRFNFSLPPWLEASSQLGYSEAAVILRDLVYRQPHAAGKLMDWLKEQSTDSSYWEWLTLTKDPVATQLYFEHCRQYPNHLAASVFQGSSEYLSNLSQFFSTPSLAEDAANAVADILAKGIEWQPVLKDAETGEALQNSPIQPVQPDFSITPDQVLISGKDKTAIVLAEFILNKSARFQEVGWLHLGQAVGKPIPNLSFHWAHTQWQFLKNHIVVPEVIDATE